MFFWGGCCFGGGGKGEGDGRVPGGVGGAVGATCRSHRYVRGVAGGGGVPAGMGPAGKAKVPPRGGANHPVRDIRRGRVYITSQNHGYYVLSETVDPAVARVEHVNVNDGTCEGLGYVGKNIFTVQFHPEASPGPVDSNYLFDDFMDMIALAKKGGVRNA